MRMIMVTYSGRVQATASTSLLVETGAKSVQGGGFQFMGCRREETSLVAKCRRSQEISLPSPGSAMECKVQWLTRM
jgi:hypothetical protein